MAYGNCAHKSLVGTAAIVAWSSISWRTLETIDHPAPSIIFALFLCGVVLRLFQWYYARDDESSSTSKDERGEAPAILDDEFTRKSRPWGLSARHLGHMPSFDSRRRRRVIQLVVGCVVLRVVMLSHGGYHIECKTENLEIILMPLLLGIYETVAIEDHHDTRNEHDIMWSNPLMDIYFTLTPFRARFLPPTFLLCAGLILTSMGGLSSTYICSSELREAYPIALFQGLGVVLDFILLVCLWHIFVDNNSQKGKLGVLSSTAFYSAAILTVIGIASLLYSSGNSMWLPSISVPSMWPILNDGIILLIGLLGFMYLLSEIRPLVVIIVGTFAWAYTPLMQAVWTNLTPFPPSSKRAQVFGLLLLYMGFITFMQMSSTSERSNGVRNFAKRVPIWFYVLLTISFLVAEGLYIFKPLTIKVHPIDTLMYNARTEGDRWRVHAFSSMSLEAAVEEYRSRYRGRAPPPNFDKWYEFAKERGCPVVDNYDQIDRDLLPFWAIPPSTIRERSALQLPSNDIFAIQIRNGRVEASPFSNLNMEWNPDETIETINKFAQWLPEMYIAFNLRDTPRVALPWKQINNLKKQASSVSSHLQEGKQRGFTTGDETNSNWPSIKIDYSGSESYKSMIQKTQRSTSLPSYPSIFQNHEGPSCPPYSPVGLNRVWHAHGFCAACASPHSQGQFLQSWTASGDLCHQPDMAKFDGFLISPGTDKEIGYLNDELVPVFSRSKVSGYHDILFPAPGGYIELSDPRPNEKIFSEMSNTLLWRGPAEDDMSTSQTWRGKTSHRLAHIVHNSNSSQNIAMLLPTNDPEKLVYQNVPARELAGLLDMDIGLTECELCNTREYFEQKRILGTKPVIPEQEKFNYRYLFVPDETGASNRFISFLRSNAVPFRSSIFRSWYDDRLVPWLHYVPIDGRLQAVHSTLAFFAGLKGKVIGRDIDMPQRFRDASFIADQGRKWVEKALRREDAEVYLFRLLLEYGRLVDDKRDDIGYQLNG